MILDNHVVVDAPPDEVFALLNDVERVAGCLPGAALEGGDGETYTGGVKVRVGPISAAYTGTVRFLETDKDRRYLRLQARGTDTKGSGDAEAQVELTVEEAASGSVLRLRTDLLIRGKIAQFGKGAIGAVSAKLLGQFAVNLAGLLAEDRTGVTSVRPAAARAGTTATPDELDGLALLLGPSAKKYVPVVAAFAFGLFEGWLLGKLRAQSQQLKQVRRG
jgi:carbon monoxide dehydrogenase subunit G